MKDTAIKLTEGDYGVNTGVVQKDEIGELAESIDTLSGTLRQANEERERLDQLRRDFVANVSHELRTPVTVIRGSIEAMLDGIVTDPDQMKCYYSQILNESVFLQRLINDLLDLSRLQNADFKIEMQQLNLCDLLQDAAHVARRMAINRGIEIRLEMDGKVFPLYGDYGRLRQMFLIVLDNAIKFSADRGVVVLSLKNNTVSIRDNGEGIDREDIPYVFDRFYKADSKGNQNGTGLGLAIAKQIADRHGITVSVSSTKEDGTEFLFRFN